MVVFNELSFEKVLNDEPEDPNAPTVSVGYVDENYNVVKNRNEAGYTVTKYATAEQWESGTLAVNNYSSAYSAFSIKFTTEKH